MRRKPQGTASFQWGKSSGSRSRWKKPSAWKSEQESAWQLQLAQDTSKKCLQTEEKTHEAARAAAWWGKGNSVSNWRGWRGSRACRAWGSTVSLADERDKAINIVDRRIDTCSGSGPICYEEAVQEIWAGGTIEGTGREENPKTETSKWYRKRETQEVHRMDGITEGPGRTRATGRGKYCTGETMTACRHAIPRLRYK